MNFDKKSDSLKRYTVIFLSGFFILLIGFFIGSVIFPQTDSNRYSNLSQSSSTSFSKLNSIIQTIGTKFYYRDRLQKSDIEDGTIKGYLNSLEDFPTRYMSTQEYSQYKDVIAGNIFGIGIEIGVTETEGSKVASVYPDTPAERAGLKKGDIILKVDDRDTSKTPPSQIASYIRGPINTKVKLVLQRGDEKIEKEITRDKITTKSVNYENLNRDGVCKISIQRFTDESVDKWKDTWNTTVQKFQDDKCKKAIIDVRGNGGGYVEASKYAIEEFIPDGTVIYGQKKSDGTIDNILSNRDQQARSQSGVEKEGHLRNIPVIVMINASSASASEIFSGALQNTGRAKIIGTNSFGKGSEQDTTEYTDGSALVYTFANWTLPDGQVIDQNFPIKPDFVVPYEKPADVDPQIEKAVEVLK